jgi:hypothetical protein
VPQLAGLIRDASARIEDFSRQIRSQSASELAHTVSQFARRRPAVVFGLAAACGFLAFRLLNASSPRRSSASSPDHRRTEGTDWRPDPRLGGSAYPVSSPAGSGSNIPSSTPVGGSTHSAGTAAGGGSTHSAGTAAGGGSTHSAGTAPGGGSTPSSVSGETSRPISPSPGRFHGA